MKIQDGFVIGTDWQAKKTRMVPIHMIESILMDAGNQPRADRIFLIDGRGHVDLYADDREPTPS